MYAFRDIKMKTFSNPFVQANDEVAKRTAKTLCNDERSEMFKIAEDIEFWKISEWDDQTGVISGELPEILINTGECKK